MTSLPVRWLAAIVMAFAAVCLLSCAAKQPARQFFQERAGIAYGSIDGTPAMLWYDSPNGRNKIVGAFIMSSLPGAPDPGSVGMAVTRETRLIVRGRPVPGGVTTIRRRGSEGSAWDGKAVVVRFHNAPYGGRIVDSIELQ